MCHEPECSWLFPPYVFILDFPFSPYLEVSGTPIDARKAGVYVLKTQLQNQLLVQPFIMLLGIT